MSSVTIDLREGERRTGVVAMLLLGAIHAYQRWVSPLFGPHCRFFPSCSSYAAAAVIEHGALRGGWLAIRRLGRCHPFHPGGHDPVPASTQRRSARAARRERSSKWAS